MTNLKPKRRMNVLCVWRGTIRRGNSSRCYIDSLMIEVERSGDILGIFRFEMNRRVMMPNQWRVHPMPDFFELVGYLPECGKPTFDLTWANRDYQNERYAHVADPFFDQGGPRADKTQCN